MGLRREERDHRAGAAGQSGRTPGYPGVRLGLSSCFLLRMVTLVSGLRTLHLTLVHEDFLLHFFLKIEVLYFAFLSTIHFELMFV